MLLLEITALLNPVRLIMKSRLDLETHTCEDRLELNFFFSQARANTNIFFRSKLPETDHFQVEF